MVKEESKILLFEVKKKLQARNLQLLYLKRSLPVASLLSQIFWESRKQGE